MEGPVETMKTFNKNLPGDALTAAPGRQKGANDDQVHLTNSDGENERIIQLARFAGFHGGAGKAASSLCLTVFSW